jgi:hypothetical protein
MWFLAGMVLPVRVAPLSTRRPCWWPKAPSPRDTSRRNAHEGGRATAIAAYGRPAADGWLPTGGLDSFRCLQGPVAPKQCRELSCTINLHSFPGITLLPTLLPLPMYMSEQTQCGFGFMHHYYTRNYAFLARVYHHLRFFSIIRTTMQ